MKEELFDELRQSIQEGAAILRQETTPARTIKIDAPRVQDIRKRLKMSQGKFASMFGISLATLRNWEQGRRAPEGPARILLQVVDKHPEAVWDVVGVLDHKTSTKKPK